MSRQLNLARHRRRLRFTGILTAVAVLALAGVALAKVFTLNIAKHATVHNQSTHATKHEWIAVNSKGFAIYFLTNDTKAHPGCTKASGCWIAWPPLRAKHPSEVQGLKGKLGVWRHGGISQVTVDGAPAYLFSGDGKAHVANGEGIVFPHGVWHVITVKWANAKHSTSGSGGGTGGSGGGGGW